MDETRDHVVQLLNEAATSTDADAKLKNLLMVQELTVNKEPELLDNFFEEILQFQHDRSVNIRKHLIGFVEASCKKDWALLPRAVPTLLLLLQDETSGIKKRVILANTNLYKSVLQMVNKKQSSLRRPEELWAAVQQMKDEIRALIGDKNDGVRTAVLKFLETHVLAQSRRTANSEARAHDVGLETIPTDHPVLNVVELKEDADVSFTVFMTLPAAPTASSTNITAAISILSAISRLRPTYMPRAVEMLVGLHRTPPPHLKRSQLSSVHRALKTPLMQILKHAASAELHDQLVPVLEAIGVPVKDISEHDMRGQLRATRGGVSATKDVPADGAPKDAGGPAADPRVPALTMETLARLPLPMIVELLMVSMKNLPPTLPAALLAPSGAAAAAGDKHAMPTAAEDDGRTAKRIKAEPSGDAGGASSAAVAVQPAAAPPVVRRAYAFKAATMSEEQRKRMVLGAFERVLAQEGRVTEDGARRSRVLLVARMASVLHDTTLDGALVRFVVASPKERAELALVWLYHQYQQTLPSGVAPSGSADASTANAVEEASGGTEEGSAQTTEIHQADARPAAPAQSAEAQAALDRYNQSAVALLSGLKDTLQPTDPLIRRLLMELPYLSEGVLGVVKSYCEDIDGERNRLGFLSLHELIKYRPPVRAEALPVLLKYTRSVRASLRGSAIPAVKSLWKIDVLRNDIEDFAVDGMKLVAAVADDDPDWTSERIKVHVELHIALFKLAPKLLGTLCDIYATVRSTNVKRVILKNLDKVRELDWTSASNLSTISHVRPGSEEMVLHILHMLTDHEKPTHVLMVAVRSAYVATQDARYLISILRGMSKNEILEALPRLVSLRENLVKAVFNRLLGSHGATAIGASALSPSELLVALHGPGYNRKDVMKALNLCFDRKRVYTHEVLGVALQQLMDQTPLPVFFMRTMIQSLQTVPRLKEFIVNILARLATRRIWTDSTAWRGFVKCCQMAAPQSYDILLGLPHAQLNAAFKIASGIKDQLVAYVNHTYTPQQVAVMSPETLKVLGITPAK
eukprot:m.287076 g.287076  ORF g.287076 m.287076 type:complete len:1034 (+) comp19944_c0_seq1:281-3382(+)